MSDDLSQNPQVQTNKPVDNTQSSVKATDSPVLTQQTSDKKPEDQKTSVVKPVSDRKAPEIKEAVGSLYKEAGPTGIIEKKEFETPVEVKKYVTEVKKEDSIDLPVPIEDEYGAVLMEAARPSKPKIVLPLDDQGIKQGVKKKVTNSVRWLVTWCLRLIKMFPKRVEYKKNT